MPLGVERDASGPTRQEINVRWEAAHRL